MTNTEESGVLSQVTTAQRISDLWERPPVIARNNFIYKSLSNWSLNTSVGCEHGCVACFVPSTSTVKMKHILEPLGVTDPDAQWGEYVFVRRFDQLAFRRSLRAAVKEDLSGRLPADGNRAIILCSTTDPYQVIYNADPEKRAMLNAMMQTNVQESLKIIRDESNLNVRILTRSPLAIRDFDLMRSFGPRLMFGMSIPTLDEKISRIYEPNAPSVGKRRETLRKAKVAGLHVYVAMAPTYPECDKEDLQRTMKAWTEIEPLTIFHEPINMRAENVERIRKYAEEHGYTVNLDVFKTPRAWADYSKGQLEMVEQIATEFGLQERLHLWPDKNLTRHFGIHFSQWAMKYWERVSEWPAVQPEAHRKPRPLAEKDEVPGLSDTGREHEGRPH